MKRLFIASLIFASQLATAETDEKIIMANKSLDYCHINNYSQEVLCGEHSVFENRALNQGRKLTIKFAVVPSIIEAKEADPLVIFAGGPGQGAMDMGAFIPMAFQQVHENRDILLIDQRGMGSSAPLDCEFPDDYAPLMDDKAQAKLTREILQECLAQLDADVTQYTQDLANEDINEIISELGYSKVNLYGVSWGTRSALLYASQFPQGIRSIILDGTAPPENIVPLYANADAEAALQALFKDCQQNPVCNKSYPNLEQDFHQVLQSFGENGYPTSVRNANTAETVEFIASRNSFVNAIRSILYVPEMSRLIPIIIEQVKNKDFRALNAASTAFGDGGMSIGTTFSVLCSEEYSRITEAMIAAETDKGFVGDAYIEVFGNGCSVWPKSKMPEVYRQDLSSDLPTLILSGDIDPVTPPRWGDQMAKYMTNSVHFVAANTGHNVAPRGCASKLIARFITQGNHKDIDPACLNEIKRPSFFHSANGPSNSPQRETSQQSAELTHD